MKIGTIWLQLVSSLSLLGPSLAAQVGGANDHVLHWSESEIYPSYGRATCFVEDLDNDGVCDILIGAPSQAANGFYESGAVYLHSGATGNLLWRFDGPEARIGMGSVLCNPGDTNGDGIGDILISAPGFRAQQNGVFLYSGADFQLLDHFFLGSDGGFGQSLAAIGDVNQDGLNDFMVGAPDSAANGGGKAYVFAGGSGDLLFTFQTNERVLQYGAAVSVAGDLDQDGYTDFLVGAPITWANGRTRCGSVYVYSRFDSDPIMRVDGNYDWGEFGASVASLGDVNQDGYSDFAVGAPKEDSFGNRSGTVYVYSGLDASLLYSFKGKQQANEFGDTVSYAGDVDGDGVNDILCSSSRLGWTYRGGERIDGIYVYSGATGEPIYGYSNRYSRSYTASTISGGKDLNGDGRAEFLCGGMHETNISSDVFLLSHYPGLSASAQTLSSSSGGMVDFHLDFPPHTAGDRYILLGSMTGDRLEFIRGVPVPLRFDELTQALYSGNPRGFHRTKGRLDANGSGMAWFQIAPGQLQQLVGSSLWFAALAVGGDRGDSYSSTSVKLEITP